MGSSMRCIVVKMTNFYMDADNKCRIVLGMQYNGIATLV